MSRSSPKSASRRENVSALVSVVCTLALWPAPARGHDLVSFENDVKPILQRSCGGLLCHINMASSGVDMTSYESLMASVGAQYLKPVVIPGDPDASPLIEKVSSDTPSYGVRMPNGVTPLPAEEINVLRRWIAEGAIDRPPTLRGDSNSDDHLNIADPVFLLDYLFNRGPAPKCAAQSDANADGKVNVSDVVFVLLHLFAGGAEPAPLSDAEIEACEAAGELRYESIYQKVFLSSCAFSSCHSAESKKADLDLSALESSYQELVGVEPFTETARAAGMKLVDPGRPENSFLLKKLGQPGPGEGARMPQSAPEPLPDAVVNAVREWILAGAPETESVEGVPDIGELPPPTLGSLPQPPLPENGIQLHLPAFSVAPRSEREIFYFVNQPFANLPQAEIIVQRIDIYMLDHSHHFIIYDFIGGTKPGPGFRGVESVADVLNTRRFVVGAQQSYFTLAFPPGVGLRFAKTVSFDLNSHYLNLHGTETLKAEVYINIHFAEPGSVTTFVKPIFEINPNINVPPYTTRTTSWLFPGFSSFQQDPALGNIGNTGSVPRDVHIYSLSTHMHRHGDRFTAYLIENGRDVQPQRILHDNLNWDDPRYDVFDPPLVLRRGQGIRFTTTHTYDDPPSPTAPPLTFGITSEDEMAILLGYYAIP
jgi:hypothetical protein